MKVRTSVFRRLAILSLSTLAFAACDDKEPFVPEPRPDAVVTITPSSATLTVGQTVTFVGSVANDSTGSFAGVTYSSSNTAVATVGATTGVVTAVAPGTSTIIATSKGFPTKSAAAQVVVTAAPPPPPITIALAPTTASVNVGGTVNLVAVVTGSTNQNVNYATSDATVATVSATGVVTANATKNGTAVITATSVANPAASATSIITVTGAPGPPVVAITITPPAASIEAGGTFTFVANVTGSTNTAKTFTSSDLTVATVDVNTGVVTALNKAGTTVITATASADATKSASATLTVTRPAITVTVSPSSVTLSPQQSATITSTLTGSAADIAAGVTCTSTDSNIASVAAGGCVVTGVAAGTTTVTVASNADPTKTALVTVTVAAQTQPSISIQSVTVGGAAIAPGATVTGNMTVVLNVSAGSASSIQRVAVRLGGVEACTQTFNPPLAPTQGVATITCVVNTAQLATDGSALFPNGTYLLTADAFSTASSTGPVATATFGNVVLANANTVSGSVTFDNTTVSDADNTPDAPQDVDAAGNVWNGGTATVVVNPAIFGGQAAATLDISVDVACDGTAQSTKTATITNGSGSVTFLETAVMGGATDGVDDTENANVCFLVNNARAADNSIVNIPTGTGAVYTGAGFGGATSVALDNVEPAVFTLVQPGGAPQNNYLGSDVDFTEADNVTGGVVADGGVGRVTVDFFAIPTASMPGTINQTNLRTVVNAQAAPTTNSDELASTITNTSYTLVARAVDALGNTRYVTGVTFGVDREDPTVTRTAQPADSINPPPGDLFTYTVTDTLSGFGTIELFINRVTNAGNVCVDAIAGGACDPFVTTTTGTASISVAAIDAAVADGYYFVSATGSDIAGNVVAGTDSKTILLDVANPTQGGVVVPITATAGASSTTISANVADNVDLRLATPQVTFGVAGTIPVAEDTQISTFGLPLVTTTSASATFLFIRSLDGAANPATAAGFNVEDAAFNASGPSSVVFQAGVVDATVTGFGAMPTGTGTFVLASSDANGIIDRTPSTPGEAGSTTLTATVTGNSGTLNYNIPFNRVMFTFTDRAGVERVLATVTSPNAGVAADNVNRTYTYTTTLSAVTLKDVLGAATTVRAIGVDAQGDAITTNAIVLTVN